MFSETEAARARMHVMTAFEHWTEILRCPNCGLTGVACLSQRERVGVVIVVDDISEGFKAISTKYGDTFSCEACNRAATEL
jgi:transcription elongation factor Elf1